jgi:hypothetical protein
MSGLYAAIPFDRRMANALVPGRPEDDEDEQTDNDEEQEDNEEGDGYSEWSLLSSFRSRINPRLLRRQTAAASPSLKQLLRGMEACCAGWVRIDQ